MGSIGAGGESKVFLGVMGRWMGRGLRRRLNDGLREGGLGLSIDDHLETDVGTKARFGGCMGQTEGGT